MRLNFHDSDANQAGVSKAASRLKRVGFLIGLAIVAVFSFAPRVADACSEPANGFFFPEASEQDTMLPVLRSVSSEAIAAEDDGCCHSGGYWILSVDGEDPGETSTPSQPALGYRIEVLSGTIWLYVGFPILGADRSREETLPVIYLPGDIDEDATIRITPIDRAGNEGEPVEHTLEAYVDANSSCSTQGRNSGLGMLPLLGAILFALRRRRTSD